MKLDDAFPTAGNFFKSNDFDKEKPRCLKIKDWSFQKIRDDEQEKLILSFTNDDQLLVLNRINGQRIKEIARSDDTDHWKGLHIVVGLEMDRGMAGKMQLCIRVRAPKEGSGPDVENQQTIAKYVTNDPPVADDDTGSDTPF